jgi:hypothetical protein
VNVEGIEGLKFHRSNRIIQGADRGCVNTELLAFIRDLKIEYIVGAKMRTDKAVWDEVLSRGGRYTSYDANLSYKVVREGVER